jgi:DNA mismatch endonuclease (patch repair protein)
MMARIGGRNTSPELAVRKLLWREGLRYQLHQRIEGARPDLVFPRARVAVFIDGCFWHGCPDHYVRPRSREAFWAEKLKTNIERDRAQTVRLEAQGWMILRFWEHDVARRPAEVAAEVIEAVRSGRRPRRRRDSWVVTHVEALSQDGQYERRYLQDLRNPARHRVEERERTTRKW